MEVPWIPPPMTTIDLGVLVAADIIVRDEKAWMQVPLNAVVINTSWRSLGSFIILLQ